VSRPNCAKKLCHSISQYLAFQLTYPGLKISTLHELFEFVRCADPERTIHWNIESKINPMDPSSTRGVDVFVGLQHQAFLNSGYKLSQIIVGLDFFFHSSPTQTENISTKALTGGHWFP